MHLIEKNIDSIRDLCKKHKVRSLFAFGSVLTDKFRKESDIDLIVDFQDIDLYGYAENYFDLKQRLENIFEREVDLLEEKAIKNPFLRLSIDATKICIYG